MYRDWVFDSERAEITGVDSGNCRVTVAGFVGGETAEDVVRHGELMAFSPRMYEFILNFLACAIVEFPDGLLKDAEQIVGDFQEAANKLNAK